MAETLTALKSRAKFKRILRPPARSGRPEIEITSRDSTTPSTSPSTLRPPSIFRLRSCARILLVLFGSPLPLFRCAACTAVSVPLWDR